MSDFGCIWKEHIRTKESYFGGELAFEAHHDTKNINTIRLRGVGSLGTRTVVILIWGGVLVAGALVVRSVVAADSECIGTSRRRQSTGNEAEGKKEGKDRKEATKRLHFVKSGSVKESEVVG